MFASIAHRPYFLAFKVQTSHYRAKIATALLEVVLLRDLSLSWKLGFGDRGRVGTASPKNLVWRSIVI